MKILFTNIRKIRCIGITSAKNNKQKNHITRKENYKEKFKNRQTHYYGQKSFKFCPFFLSLFDYN